jgi:hypothetical protein
MGNLLAEFGLSGKTCPIPDMLKNIVFTMFAEYIAVRFTGLISAAGRI